MNSYSLAFQVDNTVPTCRYIVSLSDGRTVYENYVPKMRTTWMRLKQYLVDTGLAITRLRLQCGDKTINIDPAEAYCVFYQEHVGAFSARWVGIGRYQSENEMLKIHWFDSQATGIKIEERLMKKDHPALIFSESK